MGPNTQAAPAPAPSRSNLSRIAQAFQVLRGRGGVGLVPFLPAGYPDLATTAACLPALGRAGASVIEIGFPFSDPIADGPTIQEAFTAALSRKLKVGQVFDAVASVKDAVGAPLVSMVSYSIVFRYGVERFARAAKAAGFDGLILPDLPPPEAQRVCKTIWDAGLDTILLVAPTTTPQRRKEIAALSTGFVYYLSVSGITGEREQLPADLADNLRQLKELTDRPLCVGFGIHKPAHLAQLRGLADGAIVGSAFVKRMNARRDADAEAVAGAVEAYARELLGGAAH